jgi:hypothetical protein
MTYVHTETLAKKPSAADPRDIIGRINIEGIVRVGRDIGGLKEECRRRYLGT